VLALFRQLRGAAFERAAAAGSGQACRNWSHGSCARHPCRFAHAGAAGSLEAKAAVALSTYNADSEHGPLSVAELRPPEQKRRLAAASAAGLGPRDVTWLEAARADQPSPKEPTPAAPRASTMPGRSHPIFAVAASMDELRAVGALINRAADWLAAASAAAGMHLAQVRRMSEAIWKTAIPIAASGGNPHLCLDAWCTTTFSTLSAALAHEAEVHTGHAAALRSRRNISLPVLPSSGKSCWLTAAFCLWELVAERSGRTRDSAMALCPAIACAAKTPSIETAAALAKAIGRDVTVESDPIAALEDLLRLAPTVFGAHPPLREAPCATCQVPVAYHEVTTPVLIPDNEDEALSAAEIRATLIRPITVLCPNPAPTRAGPAESPIAHDDPNFAAGVPPPKDDDDDDDGNDEEDENNEEPDRSCGTAVELPPPVGPRVVLIEAPAGIRKWPNRLEAGGLRWTTAGALLVQGRNHCVAASRTSAGQWMVADKDVVQAVPSPSPLSCRLLVLEPLAVEDDAGASAQPQAPPTARPRRERPMYGGSDDDDVVDEAQISGPAAAGAESSTATSPGGVSLRVAATNLATKMARASLPVNLAALGDCHVIAVAEPGDVARMDLRARMTLEAFHVIHAPRTTAGPQAHRGGSLLLVRRPLAATPIALAPALAASTTDVQCAAALISRTPGVPVACAVAVYAAPGSETAAEHADVVRHIFQVVEFLRENHHVPVIVAGDFNARSQVFGDADSSIRGRCLVQSAIAANVTMVGLPTRGNSALDLIGVSAQVPISLPTVRKMAESDHDALVADVDPAPGLAPQYKTVLAVPKEMDRAAFLRQLEAGLKGSTGSLRQRAMRITKALVNAILANGGSYKRLRTNAIREPPTVADIMRAGRTSPWAAISLLKRGRLQAPTSVAIDPADLLAAFGSSGAQRTHGNTPLARFAPQSYEPVSREEVLQAIQQLNLRACADTDGIGPRIVALASNSVRFLDQMAALLNECLSLGQVPSMWTDCVVTAIPKASGTGVRGIYLCRTLAKVADRVMDKRVRHEWTPHPLQMGFRKGVSIDIPVFACLEVLQGVHRRNAQGLCHRGALILVDIESAFPSTPATGIVQGYGDIPEALRAFKVAMLTDRRIRVQLGDRHSDWDPIVDGTNQGYVSGPTDFSAQSSGLLTELQPWTAAATSSTRAYGMVADDLAAAICAPDQDELSHGIRDFMKKVGAWAARHGMRISAKTTILLVGPSKVHADQLVWNRPAVNCGTLQITPRSGEAKYLGYQFDSRLTFASAVEKAEVAHHKALISLLPFIATLHLDERKVVYEALVLCHIRRIGVILLCMKNDAYWDRLDKLIAEGARCIAHICATASNISAIHEAGLHDSKALAIIETCRLRIRTAGVQIGSPLVQLAVQFLGRHAATASIPLRTEGVLVDRQLAAPALAYLARRITIVAQPEHTPEELALLKSGEESAVMMAKFAANTRAKQTTAPADHVFFADGSYIPPKPGRTTGGGGAAVYFFDGGELLVSTGRAGAVACSFSAETIGLESLLTLLESDHVPCDVVCRIFDDSQSLLATLAMGHTLQTDARCASLWRRLLHVADRKRLRIFARFIYAHAAWREADRADEEARTAADKGALTDRAPWWRDICRVHTTKAVAAHYASRTEITLRSKAKVAPGPASWRQHNTRPFTRATVAFLCQVRTNACPLLGGHLIQHPHKCPQCYVTTFRGVTGWTSMVEHAFTCWRTRGLRRELRINGLRALWTKPARALQYLERGFLQLMAAQRGIAVQ
jgi:hypothetical protein